MSAASRELRKPIARIPRDRVPEGAVRLASALKIDRRHDGLDIFSAKELWIGTDGRRASKVAQSVRIGNTKAADERLRFYIAGSRHLSGPRKLSTPEEV